MTKKELLEENESLQDAVEEALDLLDPEGGGSDPDTAVDVLSDALAQLEDAEENDPE